MKHNNVEKDLSHMKIKPLTKEEREQVWQHIMSATHQPVSVSRFTIMDFIRKPLVWGVLTAVLLFGGSAAVVSAADDAKPGDLLFSIDRLLEDIQLRLASEEKKTELKLQLVHERLGEIQEILAENETGEGGSEDEVDNGNTDEETDNGEGDENGGEEDNNDEESQQDDDGDNGETNVADENRVEKAFAIALDFIADIKEGLIADGNEAAVAAIDQVIEELDTEIEGLPLKLKLEIKTNKNKRKLTLEIKTSEGKQKLKIKQNGDKIDIEQKDEDGKIKVKIKGDGEVKVKSKEKGKDDDDDDEDEDEDDDNDDEDEDTTPPVVASFSPADDATEVPVDTDLVITFSEAVEAHAGDLTVKMASDDTIVELLDVLSSTSSSTNIVTFELPSDLANDTEFYVLLEAGSFVDDSLNHFEGISASTTWNFTTEPASDTQAPTIASFSPADDATEVPVDTDLVITFSEAVAVGTGNITIKKTSDDSEVEVIDVTSTTGDGTDTVTIDPVSDLESDTEYYVLVDGTAFEDTASNPYAGVSDTTEWSFTTADIVAPVISSIVSDTSTTTSTVTWSTDEAADSTVWYGTSTPVLMESPFLTATGTDFVTDHTIELSGLTEDTVYHFLIVSKDVTGNEAISDENSFTTQIP